MIEPSWQSANILPPSHRTVIALCRDGRVRDMKISQRMREPYAGVMERVQAAIHGTESDDNPLTVDDLRLFRQIDHGGGYDDLYDHVGWVEYGAYGPTGDIMPKDFVTHWAKFEIRAP